jgi:hypothetical protein
MTPDLQSFSSWTLALLPRLFLYPGGLWMLAALLWLRVNSGGLSAVRPSMLLRGLAGARLGSLATAWAALALLPLPGAATFAIPADRLALVALLAVSLVFDDAGLEERYLSMGITLAAVAPVASQRSLISTGSGGWADWLAALAIGVGLFFLPASGGLAGKVRLLGWLGLGSAPLWALLPSPGLLWVSVVYAIAIGLLGLGRKLLKPKAGTASIAIVALLATLALVVALYSR